MRAKGRTAVLIDKDEQEVSSQSLIDTVPHPEDDNFLKWVMAVT